MQLSAKFLLITSDLHFSRSFCHRHTYILFPKIVKYCSEHPQMCLNSRILVKQYFIIQRIEKIENSIQASYCKQQQSKLYWSLLLRKIILHNFFLFQCKRSQHLCTWKLWKKQNNTFIIRELSICSWWTPFCVKV